MFACRQCGSCCQLVGQNEIFKHLDRGDSVCKYYLESERMCSIYSKRPLICRVDAYFDEYLSNLMSQDDYYQINYEACMECRKMIEGDK